MENGQSFVDRDSVRNRKLEDCTGEFGYENDRNRKLLKSRED